jgi:hypothetical protein
MCSMITVGILIPDDDCTDNDDRYLLTHVEGRGWWLPHGPVGPEQTTKSAAQKIATEVSFVCWSESDSKVNIAIYLCQV